LSTRDDGHFLNDIVEAADTIAEIVSGRTRAGLDGDKQLRGSVLYYMVVIGEACSRVSSGLKKQFPTVDWTDATAMRNHVAHGYFALNLDIVWETAIQDVPKLRKQIITIQSSLKNP
jgi:uncharacterized protein with HEPN domain